MDLARKMVEVLSARDPYGFQDAYNCMDDAVTDIAEQIANDPLEVIAQLLDMIEADTI